MIYTSYHKTAYHINLLKIILFFKVSKFFLHTKMLNCSSAIFLLLICFFNVSEFKSIAQADTQEYHDFVNGAKKDFGDFNSDVRKDFFDFNGFNLKGYNEYFKADSIGFSNFTAEIKEIWGSPQSVDKYTWEEYIDNNKSRFTVNFKTGNVVIETVVDNKTSPEACNSKLLQIANTILTSKGTTKDYSTRYEKPVEIQDRPILNISKSSFLNEVKDAPVEKIPIKNGQKSNSIARIELKLAPDYIKQKTNDYLQLVQKYTAKYNLTPELVLAVIHCESNFNPKARSSCNAIGLMQLVPTSGGREAYRYVYNRDEIPSDNYLMLPENNIELGCAYLHYLINEVFSDVNNSESKKWLAVAAYNTGARNVRATLSKQRKNVNNYTPLELHQMLVKSLQYSETRNYLILVKTKESEYKGYNG
jgi:membrane-bound lytic murein transglycosylase C